MQKLIKKRSKKIGLPAGTLIHSDEEKTKEVKIKIIDYDENNFQEKDTTAIEECFTFRDKASVTWINIEGIHKVDVLEKLGSCYGLHPLVLEDIMTTDQRPKMEDFGNYIYIVLKMLYNNKQNQIITEQVSLILGHNFVISFQEGIEGDVFNNVRERISGNKGLIRNMGADYLAYAMLDSIVDSYFIILETFEGQIELLEDELIKYPKPKTLHKLHSLKREAILLRRSVWPFREVISALERRESQLIKAATAIYLRDVYDHTIQVSEIIETFRDILAGMLDIYLTSLNNRLNEVMKVLTIIATIFIPLTFIVGVYGMNFKYMPELEWRSGYPLILMFMFIISLSMLVYFRRKKWI